MESLVFAFTLTLLSCTSFTFSKASLATYSAVEWKSHRPLYDYNYKSYGSITLVRFDVPVHAVKVTMNLNAVSSHDSCTTRKVNVYSNQDGIPVVRRDGEVFPENFHTPKFVPNITISTNNKTNEWILGNLIEGSLFVMAILPHDDTRIRQKGLFTECNYYISIRAVTTYYAEDSIPSLTNQETREIMVPGQSKSIIGMKIPTDTTSFELRIDKCNENDCNVRVSLWQSLSPGMWTDKRSVICNKPCTIVREHPCSGSFAYIGLNVLSTKDASIPVTLTLNTCTQNGTNDTASASLTDYLFTGCVLPLNRYKAPNSGDFQEHFVTWNPNEEKPSKTVSVEVPEDALSLLRFKLRTADTGASLNIGLVKPERTISQAKQHIELMLCASFSRIVAANSCSSGASIKINSTSKKEKTNVIIPYPQGAIWYISVQSRCYNESFNFTSECEETPRANVTVSTSSCLDGGCGSHGECKIYSGADIMYTACSCNTGWRGYGCNDGSKSESLTLQRVAIFLLTLSNLAFIPGICLALYRRYFIEAFVYAFNMFFSTFYHACDRSYVYKLCIWPWGTLIFADFFASLMSFAVTLLAMARIPMGVRSFLHMVAAMFIAVGEVHDRHGLFTQLTPIASGLGIVAVSWGYEMYKRKSLFPSKRRYLIFIAPGLALAVLGLSLNLGVETDENYKYVHSTWHVLVATTIVFLLPPRRSRKWSSEEQLLSIQSGDVTSSTPSLFDRRQPGFQNADDPNPTSHSTASESTLLNNGGSNFMLTRRAENRRNNPL